MDKKLNVCILNDSFPPLIDGVANTAFNYANILNNMGCKVVVSTPFCPEAKDNYNFDVLRYPSIDTTNLVGYRAGLPYNPNYTSKFIDYNLDILHTHCPVMSTIIARIIRKSIHKPIIFTYHTKFDVEIRKAVDSKILVDTAFKVLVENIEACDEVWVVSKGAGENMSKLGYTGDYIVMPNGVDFDSGKSSKALMDEVILKYKIDKSIPTYLFVGRMYWYKGIKIILDALKLKKLEKQKFQMLFVGDGRELEEIKSYCKELDLEKECIFTGPIYDRTYLKAIFSISDLFLFPSTYDTNGLVVKEAASSLLGSVLIKGSCAAEDTIDKTNCLWIDENGQSLAKVLIGIGDNFDYYQKLGKKANEDLYLSWDDAVNNAYKRYEYVLDRYQYQKPKDTFLSNEGMLTLISKMANVINKSRNAKDKTKDSILDIYHQYGSRKEEIAYYLSTQSQETIDDYLNKIILQTKDLKK